MEDMSVNRKFSFSRGQVSSYLYNVITLLLTISISTISFCQKIETVYLDKEDSTKNMYIAVIPQSGKINSWSIADAEQTIKWLKSQK